MTLSRRQFLQGIGAASVACVAPAAAAVPAAAPAIDAPALALEVFRRHVLRRVAAALDLPYEQIKDWGRSTPSIGSSIPHKLTI